MIYLCLHIGGDHITYIIKLNTGLTQILRITDNAAAVDLRL